MERRLWLQLTFSENIDEYIENGNRALADLEIMSGDIGKQMSFGYKRRVVSSYPDLIEKIMVFDEEMDDQVLELTKLFLKAKLHSEGDQIDEALYFNRIMMHPEDPKLKIILFNDSLWAPYNEFYESLEKTLESFDLNSDSSLRVVDERFAGKMLNELRMRRRDT